MPPIRIGSDSFAFEKQIGQGVAGQVWRVRSITDDRRYALKIINKKGQPKKKLRRFRNEIGWGKGAHHRNVVRILADEEDEQRFVYLMDLYPSTLRKVIEEELDVEVLLDYLAQLSDAVAYAHDAGVVHRDIKPENVLVDLEARHLVLADFGIAHFRDSTLTTHNDLLANRNYQAPEQMTKKDARSIGHPADVFALGLVATELFTKQSPRGSRPQKIRDFYPHMAGLDDLVEEMTLQDDSLRPEIESVRDSIHVIRGELEYSLEEIKSNLSRSVAASPAGSQLLERAARDVLSIKHLFERVSDEDLARYNANYHCEIGYNASPQLFNVCVQSELYSLCKRKFEYEAGGSWDADDMDQVTSSRKDSLVQQFEVLQAAYPIPPRSIWGGLSRRATHYFRFCKDYHCDELLARATELLASTEDGSLRGDLLGVPLIWLAKSARRYLGTDWIDLTPANLAEIDFERNVTINWDWTDVENPSRIAAGANLFDKPRDAEEIARALAALRSEWDVSVAARTDGRLSIRFRSLDGYSAFRRHALRLAAPHYAFEGDVLDLLQPEAEYDDLVTFVWDREYDVRITLSKLLGLRKI